MTDHTPQTTTPTRDEALEALRKIHNCGQSAEPDHWKFRCMARDVARKVLENGPAGLADATSKSPDPDLSSLRKGAEDRIRELEKALETAVWQRDRLSKSRFHWVQRYLALRDSAVVQEGDR